MDFILILIGILLFIILPIYLYSKEQRKREEYDKINLQAELTDRYANNLKRIVRTARSLTEVDFEFIRVTKAFLEAGLNLRDISSMHQAVVNDWKATHHNYQSNNSRPRSTSKPKLDATVLLFDEIRDRSKLTLTEVKKAYRIKAKLHHPDTGGDVKKFRQIQTAYEILKKQVA